MQRGHVGGAPEHRHRLRGRKQELGPRDRRHLAGEVDVDRAFVEGDEGDAHGSPGIGVAGIGVAGIGVAGIGVAWIDAGHCGHRGTGAQLSATGGS